VDEGDLQVPDAANENGTIEIDLLGSFGLRIDGVEVAPLPRKIRTVLAYLVACRGSAIPRETLMGLFWGERGDEQARASLRQTLSQIRQALGPGFASMIVADRENVQFTAPDARIDIKEVARFRNCDDIERLTKTLEGVRGEFLEGLSIGEPLFEQWLITEREAVRRQLIGAFTRLAQLNEGEGRIDDAITAHLRVLGYDTYREETCRNLMRLFMMQGRYEAALSLFNQCQERLKRELGVEPSRETIALRNKARGLRRGAKPERPQGSGDIIKVVTVREFSVAGNDKTNFLAEGLREGLFNSLDKQSAITVVREHKLPQDQANFALEGSVRSLGGRLRMTFRLIETVGNNQIWSERYDREGGDLFELEDEISRIVAGLIRGKVKESFFDHLKNARDDELTIPELLDKAAAFFARGLIKDGRVEASLRSALARDPNHSMANAMLAFNLLEQYDFTPIDLSAASRNEIANLAERAVELQASSYWARYVAAIVAQDLFGNFDTALRHAQVALQANPDFPAAFGVTGIVKCHTGDPASGIDILKQTIDATSANTSFREERELVIALFVAGDSSMEFHWEPCLFAPPALPQGILSKLVCWDFWYRLPILQLCSIRRYSL